MLNIVIPMAGRGSRFTQAGYSLPKPLIDIFGMPMIQVVIKNLTPKCEHRFIFLCLKEHIIRYSIDKIIRQICPDSTIVTINTVTKGAACTVLLAKEYIDNKDSLMIANSDQWVDVDINDYLESMQRQKKDGFIMTMSANHPKWSYVKFDRNNKIIEVVEKKVVSNEATVGIYNYAAGKLFVDAAEAMIAENLRVNGEFYVAPAYNKMIESGANLGYYNVGKEFDGMYGLGTPEDLEKFKSMQISQKAACQR